MSEAPSRAVASEPNITSIQSVNCPACAAALFFTDSYEDFERHHKTHPQSEVMYQGGIDMGSWRPGLQLRVKGRIARVVRTDLNALYVYPIMCPHCRKIMVAHLYVTNAADIQHYEEMVRPKYPPKHDWDEVTPKWGTLAFTPVDFLNELKEIRNPMVRAAVVRKLQAAGWKFIRLGDRDVSVEEYVLGPPKPGAEEPQ